MIIEIKFWVKLEDGSDELVELVIDLDTNIYVLYWPDDQYILSSSLESLREVIDTVRGAMGWSD